MTIGLCQFIIGVNQVNIMKGESIMTKKIMTDKERKILKTFEELIPQLNETEREKILSFGEGMAFFKNHNKSTFKTISA